MHESGQTIARDYYCGQKESEVPRGRHLLAKYELAGQKLSFDALHCKPKTLAMIVEKRGRYVVGLKENQKELLKTVSQASENQAVLQKLSEKEKGHGRIETRSYEFYDLSELEKDERRVACQIRTAVKVIRRRDELKTGKKSKETSYCVSNEVGNYEEIAAAIRQRWQVETNNHRREVILREDAMRSKKRI